MHATDADVLQLFHAFKLGLSRAVAACTPRSVLDDLERVVVTLECATEAPRITTIDESTIQTWAVRRDRQVKAGIAVSALPATPKAGTTPFGGSQLCFALTEDVTALEAAEVLQAVMEAAAMVAPPCQLRMHIRGLPQPQEQDAAPLTDSSQASMSGAESGTRAASHGSQVAEGVAERVDISARLDMEPLPHDVTPDQRLLTGLEAWFEAANEEGAEEGFQADLSATAIPAEQLAVQIFLGKAGKDYDGEREQGATLARCKWTGQVALVLRPAVNGEDDCMDAPMHAEAQLLLFHGWAPRPGGAEHVLKAVSRCRWPDYGLLLTAAEDTGDGGAVLKFGRQSDDLAARLAAVVVHVYTPPLPVVDSARKLPALSPTMEAKLVRAALEDALAALKQHHPGSLNSKLERRMQHALPYLAKTIAGAPTCQESCAAFSAHPVSGMSGTIANRQNPELQEVACEALRCDMGGLQEALLQHLHDTAGREIYEQRRPGSRDERDRDGRRAIGMDRIREEGGWLTEDNDAMTDDPQDMQVALDDEDL